MTSVENKTESKNQLFYKIIDEQEYGNFLAEQNKESKSCVDNNSNSDMKLSPKDGFYFLGVENILDFVYYGYYLLVIELPMTDVDFKFAEDENMWTHHKYIVEKMAKLKDPSSTFRYLIWRSNKIVTHKIMNLKDPLTFKYLMNQGAINKTKINFAAKWACEHGYLEVVKFLFGNGADIRSCEEYSIFIAVRKGHFEIIKFLINNGANPEIMENYAIKCAAEKGYYDIVAFLVDNGANFKIKKNYPIRVASEKGHLAIVKLLIEKGANFKDKNDYAITYALKNGHLDIVKLLVEKGAPDKYLKKMNL